MKALFFACTFVAPVFNLAANEKLKAESEMPIVAWIGADSNVSEERFLEMKKSGINTNLWFCSNIAAAEKALEAGHKTGVKAIASCPELKSDPENTVKRLMKRPYNGSRAGRFDALYVE